jgi:hypothetical protein
MFVCAPITRLSTLRRNWSGFVVQARLYQPQLSAAR